MMGPALLSVPRDVSPFLSSSDIRKECSLPVVAGCIPKSSRMLDAPRTGHPAWCPPTLGRAGPSDLTALPVTTLSPFPFMPKSVIPCLWSQACSCQGPHPSVSFQLLALGFSPPCSNPAVLPLTAALGGSLTSWHVSLHTK